MLKGSDFLGFAGILLIISLGAIAQDPDGGLALLKSFGKEISKFIRWINRQ